ncbi:Xylose isomerase domain-containing protein TIM barrel [Pseudofrankia inefficax]|uniref:Xylose isomerase domain-containing protein TIM barrel n=1 Tax=Pseudofrankia inefficax (strain DSM 45817 / CECT 9037 / DDB 130130 / EuI1c) TaxID=298654 RepID=E3J689_PSEI1|nr:Xylose isomerase domain-containing protein TIM barrel [Pseudofrankia inefficax]
MTGTLGVQLYSVRDSLAADRPSALRRLADLGYRYVEPFVLSLWNTPAEQSRTDATALRADLDAAGLAVSSLHGAIAADSQATLVETCHILGTDTVFVPIPFLVEGFDGTVFEDRQTLTAFALRLNSAAGELAEHGIRLGYHNHTFEWAQLPDGTPAFDVFWDLLDPAILAESFHLHSVTHCFVAHSHLGPADKKQRSDGVERCFAVAAGDQGFRDVQGQRYHAREDEQPPCRAQHLHRTAVHSELPAAEQKAHDRQINRGRDERRYPHRNTETQLQREHIPEPEEES